MRWITTSRVGASTLLLLAAAAAAARAAEPFDEVRRRAEAARQAIGAPALSIAAVQGDRLMWAEGLGQADVENDVPAREHGLAPPATPRSWTPWSGTAIALLCSVGNAGAALARLAREIATDVLPAAPPSPATAAPARGAGLTSGGRSGP